MADERGPDSLDALFAGALAPRRKKFDAAAELARRRVLAQIDGARVDVPVSLGRFELLRCVGRGGMGTVFEARDRSTGAAVALKCLDDASLEGLVVAVVKEGYAIGDTLLRPASVVVGARP